MERDLVLAGNSVTPIFLLLGILFSRRFQQKHLSESIKKLDLECIKILNITNKDMYHVFIRSFFLQLDYIKCKKCHRII